MKRNSHILPALTVLVIALVQTCPAAQALLDLTDCVLVTTHSPGKLEKKAITVFREEIFRRAGIEPAAAHSWPEGDRPVIAAGLLSEAGHFAGPFKSELERLGTPGIEGFCLLTVSSPRKAAIVAGKDTRGLLYGLGRLLRKMELCKGSIRVPGGFNVMTTPKYGLRGHQLGYRPKTNSYDAWSVEQFDRYVRELAFFGCNAIELIPPISDDRSTGRHMKVAAMEMMTRMSEIADSYGMDLWIWYPNVGGDFTSEKAVKAELAERENVFRKLKRIDAVLVPGGDPGHLQSNDLFSFAEKMASVLKKHHPEAKIWISPQAMEPTREWLETFYRNANRKPEWLGGIVFGPWVKTPLPRMREILDKDLPIRRYPDITHNLACQYPVREWDPAFALTLHRECFNPRPVTMKTIHNAFDEYSCGSLTYSEGINDDVNKFIWGDQDWDPGTDVMETLRDYCRLFIAPRFCDEIAQGLLAQEKNWEGPLAANTQVDVTFRQWRDLEKNVSDEVLGNYRFQMGLMRAYYDAYIRRRLTYETELELRAMEVLTSASRTGALEAVNKAGQILRKAKIEPVAPGLSRKCRQLADSLFESIGCQLTVEKHGATHRTRGAFMDGIDEPLNNAPWLFSQFEKIRAMDDEAGRLRAIEEILNRTNPGPGGFYDNMGTPSGNKRLLNDVAWKDDPGTLLSPRTAFYYKVNRPEDAAIPLAWKSQAGTLYETPLRMLYENLDPNASYRVRVTYAGRRSGMVRMVADGKYEVHDLIRTRKPPVREFKIPQAATADGRLELTWTCGEGQRGSQVCEIWLIKEKT